MADLTSIAAILDREVAKNQALMDASAALKRIGSLVNAHREVSAAHAEVSAKLEDARAALTATQARADEVAAKAEAHAAVALQIGEQHIATAKEQAAGLFATARAECDKLWAEFNRAKEAVKDDIAEEIDRLRGDQAKAEEDATEAAARLADLQAQVDATQGKLDAIRAAAQQLAA
jgi:chromosome segregation ATPase